MTNATFFPSLSLFLRLVVVVGNDRDRIDDLIRASHVLSDEFLPETV